MFDYCAHTFLLVAHPDDESIGAGLLLQRLRHAYIVFCADGPSWWPPDWLIYGLPHKRAQLRNQEAHRAIGITGKNHCIQFLGYPDGWLITHLEDAYRALADLLRAWQPQHVVTHAFEGGHEDHDACSFLASQLSKVFDFQVWEMPLYYRDASTGAIIRQTFTSDDPDSEIIIPVSESELKVKRAMLSAHKSQRAIVAGFDPAIERFRPQPVYDYSRVPQCARPRKMFGVSPNRSSRAFQLWKTPS
jgi:N-acetylglucosamine malate deacetylase 2